MSVLVVVDVALIFWLLLLLTPHIIVLEIYDTLWIGAQILSKGKKVWVLLPPRGRQKKARRGVRRERVLPSNLNFQKILLCLLFASPFAPVPRCSLQKKKMSALARKDSGGMATTTRGEGGTGRERGEVKTKSSSSTHSECSTPLELNKFLSSSSSSQSSYYLAESIQAVERCLKENRENLREFFSTCYQTLLWQIFNFDESGSGWLQSVYNMRLQALNYSATNGSGTTQTGTNREIGLNASSSSSSTLLKKKKENEATVHLLLKFLSPEGPLMKAIFSADSNNLVQFAFPLERLPSKTQRMLQTQQGAMELNRNPLYRGKIKQDQNGRFQVHLGLYHYFLFWNAYFVQRVGNITSSRSGGSSSSLHRSSSLSHHQQYMQQHQRPTLAQTHDLPTSVSSLRGWPNSTLSSIKNSALHHTMRSSSGSGVNGSGGSGGGLTGLNASREGASATKNHHPYQDLLISHLEYFFKPRQTDDANEKLGSNIVTEGEMIVNVLTEFWLSESDISSGSRYLYNPPDDNLVNAVTLLVSYLGEKEYSSPAFLRTREGLKRPLYRFLREAFMLWPIESTKSLEPITNLWATYIMPWCKENVRFSHAPQDSKSMSHLLGNVPFYHYLMKHFLELCCKLVPSDPEGTAIILTRVFENLEQSPDLVLVLKVLEEGFNKYMEDPLKATANRINNQETLTPYDHMFPIIQNQLEDWDPPALKPENDLGGSKTPAGAQHTPLRNRSSRLGGNAGLFNSPLSRKKLGGVMGTPGGRTPMRGQKNQQDEYQVQKLIMFDLGPEGLPQVAIALLVRLSRDVQESSSNSILRKLVPQFRKSAFAVLPLEKLEDVSLLKNSASQASGAAKNVTKNAGASSFEWNKKSKIKSARDLYVGDWMHRPIGETEFGPLVRILVYLSQFLNTVLNFDGVRKEVVDQEDVFALITKTWNECPNKKDYWCVMKTLCAIGKIGVLGAIDIVLGILRRRGFRVNLRFMAEYSMMVLLFIGYHILKFVLRVLFF